MTATQAIGALATGVGFIYATDPVSGDIVQSVPNTSAGYASIRQLGLGMSPIAGENQAIATINISAVTGVGLQLTALTINGVSQITAAVTLTNGNPTASAAAIVTEINSTVPLVGPNYYAESYAGIVYVICPLGFGDTVNGNVLAATFSPGVTYTTTNVNGGSDNKTLYDPKIGARFWVNPTVGAKSFDPTGATEITQYIISQGLEGAMYREKLVSPSSNKFSVTRKSALMNLELNPGGALYNVKEIVGDGFQQGDLLIVHGLNAANSVVFKSAVGGTDNIHLVSGADYTSESANDCIVLRWFDDNTNGLGWYEVSRGRAVPATPSEMRAIGVPFSPNGVYAANLTAGGGTYTLDPAVDSHTVDAGGGGAVVLAASWVIQGGGSPLPGDSFYVSGKGSAITLGVNTITVFGLSIPTELAASGNWAVIAFWNGSTYRSVLIPDYSGGQIFNGSHIVNGSVDGSTKLTNLSVTGSKVAATTIDNTKIVVESLTGGPGGTIASGTITSYNLAASLAASLGCVYCAKTTLTSAQILTLNSVPATLVPAQGAGTLIVPVHVFGYSNFGTIQYTFAVGDAVDISVGGGAFFSNTNVYGLDLVGSEFAVGIPTNSVIGFTGINQPLTITTQLADPTVGDGELVVWVLYRVLTP